MNDVGRFGVYEMIALAGVIIIVIVAVAFARVFSRKRRAGLSQGAPPAKTEDRSGRP